MTLDLREELQKAAETLNPTIDWAARARTAGRRQLVLRRRRAALGVTTAVIVLGTGITFLPTQLQQVPTPSAGVGGYQFDGRPDDLELYAQALRQPSDRVVWAAREKAFGECLEESGIHYVPSPYPGSPVDQSRYHYLVDNYARANGDELSKIVSQSSDVPTGFPDSQLIIRDACSNSTRARLGEQKENDLRSFIFAESQALGVTVFSSQAYLDTEHEWSTCMQSAGFIVQSPGLASLRGAAPDAAGIVVADYSCQHQVHLMEFTHTAMADAVAEWLDGHSQTMLDYQAVIELVNKKAQAILEH